MRTRGSDSGRWKWAWAETWRHAQEHVLVPGGIMVGSFIAALVIGIIRGEDWNALLWGLLAGLGGLAIYILIILIWKRTIAARQIRLEKEQLSASEVLEYALKHSGLKERSKIETELRKAALQQENPITIELQPGGDSIWMPVSQDILRTHAIDLVRDCVYDFHNPGTEPHGIALYFRGREIRKLWKEKKRGKS